MLIANLLQDILGVEYSTILRVHKLVGNFQTWILPMLQQLLMRPIMVSQFRAKVLV